MNASSRNLSSDLPGLHLRMVQANYGDCLLLEASAAGGTSHILVDGGPEGIYAKHLKPELEKIAARNGKLDLVVLTHVDEDHVTGLADLMVEIDRDRSSGVKPVIDVGGLWYNTFRPLEPGSRFQLESFLAYLSSPAADGSLQNILATITQGEDMWTAARHLGIPVNPGFPQGVVSLEAAPRPWENSGFKLWVIGPTWKNLERYQNEWQKWYDRHKENPFNSTAVRKARAIDRSISNLSSIMFLAEAAGRRILMTGDGTGDDVLAGLEQSGLKQAGEKFHVQVLKVPHHGSSRSSSLAFFQAVTADQYIIPAGKHKNDGNPDLQTLVWIVESARARNVEVEILVANPNRSTKTLLKKYQPPQYRFRLSFLKPGDHSIEL